MSFQSILQESRSTEATGAEGSKIPFDTFSPKLRQSATPEPIQSANQSFRRDSSCRSSAAESRAIGNTIRALQDKYRELEIENNGLKLELTAARGHCDHWKESEGKIQDLITKLSQTQLERQEAIHNEHQAVQEIETVKHNSQSVVAELNANIDNMMGYQEVLREENQSFVQVLTERDQQIMDMKTDMNGLSQVLQERDTTIMDMTSKMGYLSDECRNLQEQLQRTQFDQNQHQSAQAQIQDLSSQNRVLSNEIAALQRAIQISEQTRDSLVQSTRQNSWYMESVINTNQRLAKQLSSHRLRPSRGARRSSPLRSKTAHRPRSQEPVQDQDSIIHLEQQLLNSTRNYSALIQQSQQPGADREAIREELKKVSNEIEDQRAKLLKIKSIS